MLVRKKYDCYQETSGQLNQSPSLTQQQFAEDADINVLYARYQDTGMFYDPFSVSGNGAQPQYGDFSDFDHTDFMAAQNMLVEARERFEALPLSVRERFNYDPAKLLEFCSDPKNREEAAKLGLLKTIPVPADPSPPVPKKDDDNNV